MNMNAAKRVLITGGAQGLGHAMAMGLLNAGYRVAITDQPGKSLDAMVEATRRYADEAAIISADLSEESAPQHVVDDAVAKLGGVDILINNAGIGSSYIRRDFVTNHVRFWEHTPEHTRRFFQINSITPYVMAKLLVGDMMERRWGRIINVTTSLDTMLREGMAGYGGSKAGLEAHTAIMAKDLAGTGVTANVLVPGGPANTPIIPPENNFDRSKLIQPEAMVAPVLWLASTSSDGVTGRRYAAVKWDPSLPEGAAERSAGAPVAWTGFGVQASYPTGVSAATRGK
jgi:NAD(P)-dependent dehydrogenase (short-subunit alcohol dehydrogenase family)